jgi:hypothetical protein
MALVCKEKNSSLGGFCMKRHSSLELFHNGGGILGGIWRNLVAAAALACYYFDIRYLYASILIVCEGYKVPRDKYLT